MLIKYNVKRKSKKTKTQEEKLISVKLASYDDKEKLISALTNSGYIVGAELEKDDLYRPLGWRVDIYKKGINEK